MAMYLRHGEFLANLGFTAGIVVRAGRKQTQTQLCLLSLRIPYNKPVCRSMAPSIDPGSQHC
jgi:hypothetical protein